MKMSLIVTILYQMAEKQFWTEDDQLEVTMFANKLWTHII